jgi:hypothetical protein
MRFTARPAQAVKDCHQILDSEQEWTRLEIFRDQFETLREFYEYIEFVVDALNEKHERDSK